MKDIEIHKQVENELAKRSHFCQKVITKLKQRQKELEEEIKTAKGFGVKKQARSVTSSMQGGAALGLRNSRKGKREQEQEKNNEDLINFLEQKLEEIEKKLTSTQNEYEIL